MHYCVLRSRLSSGYEGSGWGSRTAACQCHQSSLGFGELSDAERGVVWLGDGRWQGSALYALSGMFFFMAIMFPTIFVLGIRSLGEHTNWARR